MPELRLDFVSSCALRPLELKNGCAPRAKIPQTGSLGIAQVLSKTQRPFKLLESPNGTFGDRSSSTYLFVARPSKLYCPINKVDLNDPYTARVGDSPFATDTT
jgi:hypothetical protein